MKVEFLGVGGAFSPEIGNSSIIIWEEDKGFLVDCGETIFHELKIKGYLDKIDEVFITHRHPDHIASLGTFLYYRRFALNKKTTFYGLSDHLPYLKAMDPKFDVSEDGKEYFTLDPDKSINIIPVEHAGIPSEALYHKGILFSGDTSESLLGHEEAKEAKIIFHEVSFMDYPNNVHTFFGELCKAPKEIKSKTWLYHYNVGDYMKWYDKVLEEGFAGIATKGQIFEI